MFCIEENTIKLTKGDSATISVTMQDENGAIYNMKQGDKLILNVAKEFGASKLIKQTTTNDIKLLPNDTANLQYNKGVFTIRLESGADVFTIASGNIIFFERV